MLAVWEAVRAIIGFLAVCRMRRAFHNDNDIVVPDPFAGDHVNLGRNVRVAGRYEMSNFFANGVTLFSGGGGAGGASHHDLTAESLSQIAFLELRTPQQRENRHRRRRCV